jgi:hypothetical protein
MIANGELVADAVPEKAAWAELREVSFKRALRRPKRCTAPAYAFSPGSVESTSLVTLRRLSAGLLVVQGIDASVAEKHPLIGTARE